MESNTSTVVFLLCMHRSGSSLTANALQELGMSLGPYPLLGAHASNRHGHFESLPLQTLNRKVQERALGFSDDVPGSDEVFSRLVETKGMWPEDVEIPDELLHEGRKLLTGLVESGTISGFKDPRTVLTWPFWRQVLRHFPSVRGVVVPLLRSPHEIAMSLCTRSQGVYGYWSSLDLVAVHFARMKAIQLSEDQVASVVRFGSPCFHDDLAQVARFCGLSWNEDEALRAFDPSCVHHEPATVFHEAQILYEELGGPRPGPDQSERMGWLQAIDAKKCEELTLHLRTHGFGSIREWVALEQQLSQSQSRLAEVQSDLAGTRAQLRTAIEEMSRAQENEHQLWEECQRLRAHRDRLEAHPVLGPLLRSRRRFKGLVARSSTRSNAS